jgi:hypothetical protein
MNIIEASKALQEGKDIVRHGSFEGYRYDSNPKADVSFWILSLNCPLAPGEWFRSSCWRFSPEDLQADDWEIVDPAAYPYKEPPEKKWWLR